MLREAAAGSIMHGPDSANCADATSSSLIARNVLIQWAVIIRSCPMYARLPPSGSPRVSAARSRGDDSPFKSGSGYPRARPNMFSLAGLALRVLVSRRQSEGSSLGLRRATSGAARTTE
jgi:hypothetical protein